MLGFSTRQWGTLTAIPPPASRRLPTPSSRLRHGSRCFGLRLVRPLTFSTMLHRSTHTVFPGNLIGFNCRPT